MSTAGTCLLQHGKNIDLPRVKKESDALIADIPRMSRETAMMKVANGILSDLKTQERSVLFSQANSSNNSSSSKLPETILIDGKQRSTLNSNGKPIAQTEEGIRNFYKWFKDSKVVDEDGRPMVVYHATQSDFDSFSKDKIGSAIDSGQLGTGFYFTTSVENANNYARNLSSNTGIAGGEHIRPVYLSVTKPKIAHSLNSERELNSKSSNKISEKIQAKGFDGIKYDTGYDATWFVTFNPNQIKSAIGNNGNFDPSSSDIRYSFAGEKANSSDKFALSSAQERLANGDDAETVRQDTGWHKSVDGKWKFEISDRDAKTQKDFIDGDDTIGQIYNGVINKRGMGGDSEIFVGDIIQHPKLFAAYPSLQTIPVYLQSGKGGGYSAKHNLLLLGEDSKIGEIKSIVLHELQHAIQHIEGFATGGTPGNFKVDNFDEQRSKAYEDFIKEHPEVKALAAVAKKMGKDSQEYKDFKAKLAELGWNKKQEELSGFDKYQRLAGEVEARNTQARALFSDEHRKLIPPGETADVKDENVIVSWNGKEIASMVEDDSASIGGMKNEKRSIKKLAWHGSWQHFDKFDLSKFGTGEGGGAFGYGIHVSESKDVAKEYVSDDVKVYINGKPVYGNEKEHRIARLILEQGYDKTLADGISIAENNPEKPFPKERIEIIKSLKNASIKDGRAKGKLYRVEIPSDDKEYLLWDKPLGKQSEFVQKVLFDSTKTLDDDTKGGEIYTYLNRKDGLDDKITSNRLLSLGIKGIKYKNTLTSTGKKWTFNYTIFSDKDINIVPSEIKDAESNDIRYSISAPQDLFDDAAAIPPATYKDILNKLSFTGDKARSRSKELGLSVLTQRQLTQMGEEILPVLKQFGVERNHYDVEESTWHNMADKIANRWEKLAPNYKRFDKKWQHRNKLEQMRIASIMHDMTVSGVDPRQPEPIPNGKNAEAIFMHQKLKPEYDKLLPDTKALLNDIEKFHGDVIKALVTSLGDKIKASEMPADKKEKLIKDIEDKFKTQKGPYFPLMRFGDYWVDYNGGVQMFVTKKEQSDFIKAETKKGTKINGFGKSLQNFNKIEGVDVGFVDDVSQLIDTLDIEQSEALKDGIFQLYLTALPETSMRKRFIHRKKTPGWEQDALKSFAKKSFHDGKQLAKLRYAPAMRQVLQDAEEVVKIGNSEKQKAQLKRRIDLIPKIMAFLDNTGKAEYDHNDYKDLYDEFEDGADQRVIRRFERFTKESERNDVMNQYLDQQKALLKSVEDYQAKGDKSETAVDIIKALHKSYANMMESNTSSLTNFINQGVFTYFLGFNPASALINYFQTPGVALPVVAGRHGFIKSSKALADAAQLFFTNKHTNDNSFSIQGGLTDAGERLMYQTLTDNGTFDRTRSHDLAGLSEEGIERGTLHRDIMNASTFMFHKAEVANREITALMAYRMEFAKTGNVNQSIEYANNIVNDTHLDYSSANRPDAFQGNAARVFLQFKMYSQGMTFLWGKAAYDALISKDVSPERKAEARNIVLSLVGIQTAMAGVLGLPIGGILLAAQALAGLGDDDDDPIDVEIEIRQALNAVFGDDIGRILASGALSETGADFAGRLSLSDLWIREPDRELEGKDKAYYLLKTIAGPVAGILEDVLTGVKLIDEGNTQRGIEKMLPHSVSGVAKAYRMLDDGGATSLTGNLIYETSAWEKAIQALGMRPSGLAEQQLQNSAIKNRETAIVEAKSKLINRAALSKMNGDTEAYQETMSDIKEWNAKYSEHPKLIIKPITIARSIRSRKANQRNAVNGIVSKKAFDFVRDEEDIN